MGYIEKELERNRNDHDSINKEVALIKDTLHCNRVIILQEMNTNYCNIMEAINQNKTDITKLKTKFVFFCAAISLLVPPIANKILTYIKIGE